MKFKQKMKSIFAKEPNIVGLCCGSNINDFKIFELIEAL